MTAPSSSDPLPPRTWRQWWRQLPSAYRIAFSGSALLAFLNVALGVRMLIGWQEDPDVTALQKRGCYVRYSWERKKELIKGQHLILAGLIGRSCGNVIILGLDEDATDADLELIGRRFSRLEALYISGSEISVIHLTSLLRCKNLRHLNLSDTDINDETIKILSKLPRLEGLYLDGTVISDASVPYLQQMPALRFLEVAWTDLTPAAIRTLQQFPRLSVVATDPDDDSPRVRVSVRWADGKISNRFRGGYRVDLQYPETVHFLKGDPGRFDQFNPTRSDLCKNAAMRVYEATYTSDGGYALTLRLGDFESQPIRFAVFDGKPSRERFEFQMPVTRHEAENFVLMKRQSP